MDESVIDDVDAVVMGDFLVAFTALVLLEYLISIAHNIDDLFVIHDTILLPFSILVFFGRFFITTLKCAVLSEYLDRLRVIVV